MRLSRRPPGLAARPRGNRPPISDRRDPPKAVVTAASACASACGVALDAALPSGGTEGTTRLCLSKTPQLGRSTATSRGSWAIVSSPAQRLLGVGLFAKNHHGIGPLGEQTSRSARVCHPVHVQCGSLQGIAKSASRMYVALDKKKSWHHSEGLLRLSRSDMNFGQSQSVDLASESIPCSLAERIWEAFPRQQTYLHLAVSGIECVGYPLSSRCRRDRGDRRRNVHTEWRQRPAGPAETNRCCYTCSRSSVKRSPT